MSTTTVSSPSQRNTGRTPPTSAGADRRSTTRPSSSRTKSAGKHKKGGTPGGGGIGLGEEVKKEDATPTSVPLTWTLLTQEDVAELKAYQTPDDIVSRFAKILGMDASYKEELLNAIVVNFCVGNFLFARDAHFSEAEIGAFCAIMKTLLDQSLEKAWRLETALQQFRDLLMSHAGAGGEEKSGWDVFRPESVVKIVDYGVSSFFQHYRLFGHVFTTEQEKQDMELLLHLDEPPCAVQVSAKRSQSNVQLKKSQPDLLVKKSQLDLVQDAEDAPGAVLWPPPLAEAVPLHVWEKEEAIRKEEEKRRRVEEERLREEERKAAENPFEVLPADAIKQIASETVTMLLSAVAGDVEKALEDQRTRFLEKIIK
ncbi:hypothetical protein SpCBS45565_g02056 [Spizellomyces sp. 'palustris']|nr:hypothetical protein SpCBS45565_g02056 [Spizellomyces sp. 'palustris']